MQDLTMGKDGAGWNRRGFLKSSAMAGVSMAALSGLRSGAFAAGSDRIRLGLIGCGGRGVGDAYVCFQAAEGVDLVAMGDIFPDRLDSARRTLSERMGENFKVTDETAFVGFDAYQKVLNAGVDMVILTTPPHFRPQHMTAAVEAGVHMFVEKPVSVDPVGNRVVLEAAKAADEKGLNIVAGTQARRMSHRMEMIQRIHDGAIGDIQWVQCVRHGGGMLDWGPQERRPEWSDMEWQLRRWLFLTWLSGDFVSEMHVHELDIVNWIMGGPPTQCFAMGGRQSRTDRNLFGDVFDHFSADFQYANGAYCSYSGSQIQGSTTKNFERILGTKGEAYTDWGTSWIKGPQPFEFEGEMPNPEVRQFADLIQAIRNNEKLNEGVQIADSSLTATMCRMSAYTARELSWRWALNQSRLDLSPPAYEMGDLEMPPVAIPGQTQLV